MKAKFSFSIWASPTEPWGDARGPLTVEILPEAGAFFDIRPYFRNRVEVVSRLAPLEVERTSRLEDEESPIDLVLLAPAVLEGRSEAEQLVDALAIDLRWDCWKYPPLRVRDDE
jgi:hypothetical protein